jgi:hypothetical protein
MADSLFDILAHKDFDEPPEIAAIKQYIMKKFQETVEVIVHERDILITTSSAGLASTLRFHTHQLQEATGSTKRIILRIR